MSLVKKYRIVVVIGIAVLTVGAFISLHDNTLSEPVIRYQTTTPAPTKNQTTDHSHDHSHSHATAPHSHTTDYLE